LLPPQEAKLERVSSLKDHLGSVQRMTAPPRAARNGDPCDLVLGFDLGSTGSKLAALDAATREVVWEGYRQTLGDPVGAAQKLARTFAESEHGVRRVVGVGVTGSGREIVGSLMTTCYGADAVFVLNEIAAHAEGALS
jgi:activator of 2-hydroxyglutaryl-CoA dehydratase